MNWYKDTILVQTKGKGLYPFTSEIDARLRPWGIREGMCHLFIQHTSASLVVNENYDPSAQKDLEAFMDHLVLENEPWYQHVLEGADDSPSHMRSILTHTSLSIPIDEGRLNLGTWQGVYLFEHRRSAHIRKVLLRCLGIE